jgi:membrane-associated phospholipid phosphatase
VKRPGLTVLLALSVSCSELPVVPRADPEAAAGSWKTWVLANGADLRPPTPPGLASLEARQELEQIVQIQSARTPATDEMIRRWSGVPTAPWHALALDRLGVYWVLLPDVRVATPARSARAMALVNVAMYDALVATWSAKYAFNRPAPFKEDGRIRALVQTSAVPSYPSEHAAVAGAAAAVLSYVFPKEDTLAFHALEREAGEARIAAGVARRSDVDAGYAIGRAVAVRVIGRARGDGSQIEWTGPAPTGPTVWQPTPNKFVSPPFDGNAGSWRPWVISSGDVYRLGPPPAVGSTDFVRDLNELRALSQSRTLAQADLARYWATDAPSAKWELFMRDELAQRRVPAVHAARALAIASVAAYDAFIACWDSKFHYWLMRPITADPTLKPVFPTPPFPSYPSGHSTISTAVAEVFSELFPDSASVYRAKGRDASLSRVYAAVHYRFDVDSGDVLGERVGHAVVSYMRQDGAGRQ